MIYSSIGTWKWLPGRINSASHLYHRRVHDPQSLCSYTIMELTQYCRWRYPFSVSDIGSLYNLNAIDIRDCRIQGYAGKYQRIVGSLNSPQSSTPTLSRSSLCSVRQCPVVFGTLDVNSTDCSRNRGYDDVGPLSPGVGVALRRHRRLSRT